LPESLGSINLPFRQSYASNDTRVLDITWPRSVNFAISAPSNFKRIPDALCKKIEKNG
jgi:hypothetical protein